MSKKLHYVVNIMKIFMYTYSYYMYYMTEYTVNLWNLKFVDDLTTW